MTWSFSEDDLKCCATGEKTYLSKGLTKALLKQIGMLWPSAKRFLSHNHWKAFLLSFFIFSFVVLLIFFSSHWNAFAVLWLKSHMLFLQNLEFYFWLCFLKISFLLKQSEDYRFFFIFLKLRLSEKHQKSVNSFYICVSWLD